MQRTIRLGLLALLLLLAPPLAAEVGAATLTWSEVVGFDTGSKSLWGPGRGSASFGADGSKSVNILGIDVGAAYDVGASTGTARARLSGALEASYESQLARPGATRVDLGFRPLTNGGRLETSLGAHIDLTGSVHDVPFYGPWDPCIYCRDWDLDTDITFTPSFGVERSGSDAISVAGIGPDIGVASATLNLNATQRARFTPHSVAGSLVYTHRGSGVSRSLPFSLASASFLDLDLDRRGLWDVTFSGLDVANTFYSTMGMGFSVDFEWPFGGHSFDFANISLLDTPRFDLDFAPRAAAGSFAIRVVPEPGTTLLFASGLLGLVVAGRRRRADRG